jgi:predicted nucleic-acid-binding protein
MIGLDTNILVRYYVAATPGIDDAATLKQCEAARVLIDSGKRLMVSKTVVLELEWVLQGRYALTPRQIQKVLTHLLGMAHVEVEDKVAVQAATNALPKALILPMPCTMPATVAVHRSHLRR